MTQPEIIERFFKVRNLSLLVRVQKLCISSRGRDSRGQDRHFLEDDIGLEVVYFLEIVEWRE